MNDRDLCLEVVSRSRQPLRYIWRWISRKPLEIEAWFYSTTNGPPNWPQYANVFDHPQKRLVSRRPIWADTTPVDLSVQWEEDWLSAAVVNSHLVCDPTIQQPGFDLPCHSWTLLNHFHTGQGPCHANMYKWGLASSPLYDCREQQTMAHIVDSCPLTKLDGGLLSLHKAGEDAVSWLKMTTTKALAKWMNWSDLIQISDNTRTVYMSATRRGLILQFGGLSVVL